MTTKRALEVAAVAFTQAAAFYAVWTAYEVYFGSRRQRTTNSRTAQLLRSRGHHSLEINEYEETIASEIIHPEDLNIGFDDIGGLDSIISSLRETVIYPLVYPHLFPSSSLLSAPKGVLLFGPPGCGKTMLAKALARESGATFINITASVLTNKWFGESNKLVAAMFSLARKCQPSIVFLDEIDSFLRERSKGDHEVTGMMKAEFMTLWDGLTSSSDRIIILGATNRIADIDAAFLRRMPKRFAVGLPNPEQREMILTKMLAQTPLTPNFPVRELALGTPSLSGSDLKELCRNAAMVGLRQSMRELQASGADLSLTAKNAPSALQVRPLALDDFVEAMREMLTNQLPPDQDEILDGLVPPASTSPVAPLGDRSRIDQPEPDRPAESEQTPD